jgi:hypothetical protein
MDIVLDETYWQQNHRNKPLFSEPKSRGQRTIPHIWQANSFFVDMIWVRFTNRQALLYLHAPYQYETILSMSKLPLNEVNLDPTGRSGARSLERQHPAPKLSVSF